MAGSDRKVLIVGGGTAGWMTAALLAARLGTPRTGGPDIALIESPEIGIIGVGEGTFPTIRQTLKAIGIEEAAFMRGSDAAFKQGIRFNDWETTPASGRGERFSPNHYFHPFDPPYRNQDELDLTPYWLLQDAKSRPAFAQAVSFQKRLADARKAPKRRFEGRYAGPLNYAYHFDAGRLAETLSKHAQGLGVRRLLGTIDRVDVDETGAIAAVSSKAHGELTADLYIDCTGFRSELIGKALKTPFRTVRHVLFNDRVVACQRPYEREDEPIESYTLSTAHEAGWTWDIALSGRRGVGYVYSSDHSSDERAEQVLRAYLAGDDAEKLDITPRKIRFETGWREKQWVKNCVCVGLSGGFLEPLESTGIVLIESAINKIADFFPHHGPVDASAEVFNDLMVRRYETIVGFLKLHYCLSKREEPYWKDNASSESIPEHLQALLARWAYRPPSRYDFVIDYESFAHFSYQYILYGMNFATDLSAARGSFSDTGKAERLFGLIQRLGQDAARDLPDHRSLLDEVYAHGFADRAQPLAVPKAQLAGG